MNLTTPFAKIILLNGNWINPHLGGESRMAHLGELGIKALRQVEYFARISHRSEEALTEDSWERLLSTVVLQHGDWSVTEHINVSVEAYVDRGITHEIVRHRIGAYTQESTRFVNYAKKMMPNFIQPEGISYEAPLAGNGEQTALSPLQVWRHAISTAETCYKRLVESGVAPQIARSVFPNALASKIIMTYNLRSWRHFFLMRTSKEAHPQMRQVTIPLLEEFKQAIPLLYADIEPLARQADNMRKMR